MEECPVCLTPLSGSLTTVGCCRKQFHTECILKCIEQKNECPMCRAKQLIQVQDVIVPVLVHDEEMFISRQKIIMFTIGTFMFVIATAILFKSM